MNNRGVGSRSSLDAAFGGGMPGAGGKQMSRIMGGGGMVPPPAGMGMGMHPSQFSTGARWT